MKSKKVTIYQLTFMAMMAAVTCILGPLSVPIGQIPISLTNLVIYFTVFVLGIWAGTGSYGIYLLLGAVGLPVFSGFAGGLGKLLGPTGGYLIGFIFMALIGGAVIELSHRNIFLTMLGWVGCLPGISAYIHEVALLPAPFFHIFSANWKKILNHGILLIF